MTTLDQPTLNQEQPSYRKIAFNYGLIASMVLIVVSLISNILGFNDPRNPNTVMSIVMSLLGFGIVVGAMIMGISKHRDEDLGGYITFGRAFGLAFIMGLVIVVINTVFSYIYMAFIDSSILEAATENFETQMEEQGVEPGEDAYEIAAMFLNPGIITVFIALWLLFQNTVAGLISAAIGQKKPSQM